MTSHPFDIPIEHMLRQLTPQVIEAVVRRFRDVAAAADAVQEASLAAAMRWQRSGVPDNPRSWLTQVAFRRMVDHIRNESYTSSTGRDLRRADLSHEAIRLNADRPHSATGRHGRCRFARPHVVDRRSPSGANDRGRRVDPARAAR
jgi:predicted RNA polymerase sigma factor